MGKKSKIFADSGYESDKKRQKRMNKTRDNDSNRFLYSQKRDSNGRG